MRFQPTAGAVQPSCTVRGLGVTDALQLELDAVQLPWLIDELDEVRGVYQDQLQHATDPRPNRSNTEDTEVLERAQDQLRILRTLRAQLPATDHQGRLLFVGPTALVLDLVGGTMRNAVSALSELVHGRSSGDPEWHARVDDTAAAACAWVRTFLDCEEIELFTFESGTDERGRPIA